MASSDCLFCKIVDGKIPAKIVHQDDTFVVFEDINPVSPVHVLIIPRKHVENVMDFGPEDAGWLGALLLQVRELARKLGIEQGFRLVTNTGADSGQTVYHLHFHLMGGRPFGWPPG